MLFDQLTHLLVYRIVLSTVLLISKFYNDVYYSNQYIAYTAGISTQELNELEKVFCEMIDYKLFVNEEEYEWYSNGLLQHTALEQY